MPSSVRLAELIRGRRTGAGLTQEELAERAGISVRTVSDIERGLRRSVYKDTAQRLAVALNVADPERDQFILAARGRMEATEGGARLKPGREPLERGHIPIPPNAFIGREREMGLLLTALRDPVVRVITVTGPGGIGKTRLASEGAVTGRSIFPAGVFFVPLGSAEGPAAVVTLGPPAGAGAL